MSTVIADLDVKKADRDSVYSSLDVVQTKLYEKKSDIRMLQDMVDDLTIKTDSNYCHILELQDQFVDFVNYYSNQNEKTELDLEEKEKKDMKGFKFDFGPVNENLVHMSMYGLAIKNREGSFVSYNKQTNEIVDVDILNFKEASKFLYKMPVAIKDIRVGDVVLHQNVPMFVIMTPPAEKTLTVIDPVVGERKEILLTTSPFGFNYATKIVNLFEGMSNAQLPNQDNPFGNMWMLMALSEDGNLKDVLPLMMMNQNGNMDPMMMMLMMGDNEKIGDVLPMLMMMNMNKQQSCACGGHCHDAATPANPA